MSHYDNRTIRIRALALPMTIRERGAVVSMLLGFNASGISAGTVELLREVGITAKALRNGQHYSESGEA